MICVNCGDCGLYFQSAFDQTVETNPVLEVITAISKAGHKESNHEVTEHDYNQKGFYAVTNYIN